MRSFSKRSSTFSKRKMDPYIRALMEDGLEEMLSEELQWTVSQGEELMNSQDNAELLSAARRAQ